MTYGGKPAPSEADVINLLALIVGKETATRAVEGAKATAVTLAKKKLVPIFIGFGVATLLAITLSVVAISRK